MIARLALISIGVAALFAGSVALASGTDQARGQPLATYIANAKDGATIVLPTGTYIAEDLRIENDLTLIGQGTVVITATRPVAKGLLVPGPGTVITVRNLTFEGAASPDLNGAGIRFEGQSLTVDQCTFIENENGILATGSPEGALRVTGSRFIRNGHGDGYSHAIYQSRGRRFEIETSVFEGTRIGHHLKTLASEVSVRQNTFDDLHGETSYVVDLSAGGLMFVDDNVIIRRQSASQRTLFNYDSSRGGKPGEAYLTNNRIISEKRGFRLIRNPDNAPVTESNNVYPDASTAPVMPPKAVPRAKFAPQPEVVEPAPAGPDLSHLTPAQARAVRKLMKSGAQITETRAAAEAQNPALLYGPEFETLKPGQVAAFKFREIGEGSRFLTFGQPFDKGAVPRGRGLVAKIGGQPIATQIDPKATHIDGSLRHAIVTVLVPQDIAPETTAFLSLTQDTRRRARDWPGFMPGNWQLSIAGKLGEGDVAFSTDLAALFTGGESVWLDGPLVREEAGHIDFGPLLTVRADLRRYTDGTGRIQLSFENHKTFSSVPREISYDVRVTLGPNDIVDQHVPEHYRSSGWSVSIPIVQGRAVDVIHDPRTLVSSGALPPLDLAVPLDRRALPDVPAAVRLGDHEPLTAYMLSTGGRGDIGPMTQWAAAWATTQSASAKNAMLRVANIGQTIPWHYAEDGTGLPVRVDQRPKFWADARGTKSHYGTDGPSETLHQGQTGGWSVDLAHKPSLAYPAYLATGDLLFLRGLRHEAGYAVSAVIPEARKGSVLVTGTPQLRSAAWAMRSIGNAAFILPDDDPFKDYMVATRDRNLQNLKADYLQKRIMAKAGETEGYLNWDNGRNRRAIAAWQNDFFTIILANEARRGSRDAVDLTRWMTNFTAGRVLAAGGDLRKAAAFDIIAKSSSGIHYTSWADVFSATLALGNSAPYTGSAEGEIGVLRAALGSVVAATDDQRAKDALEMLRRIPNAEKLYAPDNQLGRIWNPQFNLDPRTAP